MFYEFRMFRIIRKCGMTRTELARLLNVHVSTVQALEKEGKLGEARREVRGHLVHVVYDDAAIEAFIKTGWKPKSLKAGKKFRETMREGNREARAIRMFNEGATAWTVAERMGYRLADAVELWRKWKLGPEGLLAELQAEAMVKAEEEWAKEIRSERRRKEWMQHTQRIAEIRANGKVPIILPERGEPAELVRASIEGRVEEEESEDE